MEQIRFLTPEQQQEVLDFAAFLRQRSAGVSKKKRIPGLHKENAYWMADDFDVPLPDEFWLGDIRLFRSFTACLLTKSIDSDKVL
ncbi:MAG: DUF2281 domain-containing protein [Oscillatoriales cyanobacterium RU_3_3]|nr:DUF2281 domain-containing protein [Microcoleus sp. SU_5_6]NJL67777.1 DUF2281 domain-containing protein [Microcoleus sp. SM1_3_4]NJM63012.1 DUF2281 domain-containing protein [Oscillatoriales cyanobacterium RU_3_3]